MLDYVQSRNGVIHKVLSDDGTRMVLENPSGSKITVTKSRHKFKPLSGKSESEWRQIAWAIYGPDVAGENHLIIANRLRLIESLIRAGKTIKKIDVYIEDNK